MVCRLCGVTTWYPPLRRREIKKHLGSVCKIGSLHSGYQTPVVGQHWLCWEPGSVSGWEAFALGCCTSTTGLGWGQSKGSNKNNEKWLGCNRCRKARGEGKRHWWDVVRSLRTGAMRTKRVPLSPCRLGQDTMDLKLQFKGGWAHLCGLFKVQPDISR